MEIMKYPDGHEFSQTGFFIKAKLHKLKISERVKR